MMCTAVQNAISFLSAILLQCGIDIAFRPAHANRLEVATRIPSTTHFYDRYANRCS